MSAIPLQSHDDCSHSYNLGNTSNVCMYCRVQIMSIWSTTDSHKEITQQIFLLHLWSILCNSHILGCFLRLLWSNICDMIHRHAITCMKVWDPCKLWVSVGYPEREGTWHRNKNKLSCLVRLCHNKTIFATTRLVISLE